MKRKLQEETSETIEELKRQLMENKQLLSDNDARERDHLRRISSLEEEIRKLKKIKKQGKENMIFKERIHLQLELRRLSIWHFPLFGSKRCSKA